MKIRIPKIAYFYWGGENLPYLRYLTLYSFRKSNPDWEIVLYIPTDFQKKMNWRTVEHKRPIKNTKDYFDQLGGLRIKVVQFDMESIGLSNGLSEVHKSDFLRWYLLSTVGGLWCDMDILFFRPVKKLNIQNMSTVVSYHRRVWRIGFLAASLNNLFFKAIFNASKKRPHPSAYQGVGSVLVKSVHGSLEKVDVRYPQYRIYNVPECVVYPTLVSGIPSIYNGCRKDLIKSDTIGLHWYGGHKLARQFIQLINSQSYKNYNNLLTWVVKKVVEE